MDIGIDLGTTFSVIAVKGKVTWPDSYPEGYYIEECDVTIIPSPDGDKTFPSVLAVNPDDLDEILFGYDAKQLAHEGAASIMFSKRAIGTDELLKFGEQEMSAKDAATHLLKYLRQCAEEAIGESVDRAVVTHPAYFELNQIAQTREACELAGLSMSQPEQLMMEPAAAALAYLSSREEDNLKIMTYDLGGGTFDVTILERIDGVISMRKFDGDPLLGGYNFDRALVAWMLAKVAAKGRKVPYDPTSLVDRARRARLLLLAESVKIQLSEQRTDKTKVTVRAPDILVDEDGKTVPFQEQITREEFEALIQDDLDSSIETCQNALAKCEFGADELDLILLVGGSTYGPWVPKALKSAFPDVPVEQLDPDSCVAAGAAIQASMLPSLGLGSGLQLILDVPARTSLPSVDVAGTLTTDDGSPLNAEAATALSVYLTIPDGSTVEPKSLAADGGFLFEEILLDESQPSLFTLKITEVDGRSQLDHEFTIEFDEDQQSTEIYNVLPKQIKVKTARGLVSIAEEGVELPAKIHETFTRLFDETRLQIPVYVDDDEIGTIVVDDIPEEAGRGSQVELDVEITRHNELRGYAKVILRSGVEAARSTVRVVFPPTQMKQLSELQLRFEDLQAEREDEEFNSQDPTRRTLLVGKGKKLVRKITALFDEQEPDRQEIQAQLRDLDKLIHPPSDDMEPPRASFLQLAEECQRMIDGLGKSSESTSYLDRLKRLQTEGEDAYEQRNNKRWAQANENLQSLQQRLLKLTGEDGGSSELPATELLKDHHVQLLDQIRGELEARRSVLKARDNYVNELKPRLDKIEDRIDGMMANVERVDDDLEPSQALAQLQLAVRGSDKLSKEIEEADATVR